MARHYVTVPVAAFNSFDLPAICFVTGSREKVRWRRRIYRWTPPWVALLIVCFPIGVFFSVWLHRTVRVEIPVTDSAWARWRLAEQSAGLAVLGTIFAGFGALSLASRGITGPATALGVLALALPFVTFLVARRSLGPRARRIDGTHVDLVVRNAAVAAALEQHFGDPLEPTP